MITEENEEVKMGTGVCLVYGCGFSLLAYILIAAAVAILWTVFKHAK